MATAKKAPAAPAKKAVAKAPAKAPVKALVKAAAKAPAKVPAKKAATKVATKAAAPAKAPAKTAAAAGPLKPIKETLGKTALLNHLAADAAVDLKAVKAVVASLERTIAASLAKKGAGVFALPGFLKVTVQSVPARKAYKGIDRFTKQERLFPAKPASTKVKVRALKKLKDVAGA